MIRLEHNPLEPKPARHTPQRTCAGCRRIDEQQRLLRTVADPAGRLQVDCAKKRAPGRGCYVHRTTSCINAAVRGGFQRSLRRSLRLNDDEIRAVLAKRDDS